MNKPLQSFLTERALMSESNMGLVPPNALSVQVAGNHYKDMKIQLVEFIHTNGIPYLEGNVIKYMSRWRAKGGLADLEKAAQAVQALYVQAGWAAVVVYLPPQPVADGVVTLNVVEGKVAKVQVQGAQRLSAERVRAALPSLVEGATPRVRRIDAELQIANENPGRSMAVLLGPGAAPGEVQATVKVEEQPVHRFSASLDNSGNDRTGAYRLGLGWQHADLTGHDDLFSLNLQTSPTDPGMVRVASLGYRWPLPGLRAAVDLFAAYSNVDGGTQTIAAGDLSFAGAGRIAGARMVWYLPRLGEFDQRLTTGLETRAYLNDCSVAGLPAGACGAAGESVSVQPLSLEWAAQQGGTTPMLFTLGMTQNLALGGGHSAQANFDAVRPGAPRRYTVLRGGAQEKGRRAGTENVPGIAGFGAAAALCRREMLPRWAQVAALRDALEARLLRILGARVHGDTSASARAPGTLNIAFSGVEGELLFMNLDLAGIAVSTGAACSSGSPEPSAVLLAMGLERRQALEAIRISLGPENSAAELEQAAQAIEASVALVRASGGPSAGQAR